MFYRSSLDVPHFPATLKLGNVAEGLSSHDRSENLLVICEYIRSALETASYYSLGPMDDFTFICFQLIWLVSPRCITVNNWANVQLEPKGFLRAGILRMNHWGPPIAYGLVPASLEVCALGAVEIVDLMKFAPSGIWQKTLRHWKSEASDEARHITLLKPVLVQEWIGFDFASRWERGK